MNKLFLKLCITAIMLASFNSLANEYDIDTQGGHASINFRVKHIGYSWLTGRFNSFSGHFNYNANDLTQSSVKVEIDTNSVDSNHAERDKHLRGKKFLDVKKFPDARFISSSVKPIADNKLEIIGNFTLRGITKSVTITAEKIGEGDDPWGGYRAGFSGTTSLAMRDFDFASDFGTIELSLHVEGIKR